MTEVKFFDPAYEPGTTLTYSVISARYNSKWVFVRHCKRTTWEVAGGHIEQGETSHQAAHRELMEETGALKFDLDCVATYSVTIDGITGWGRLYYAEIHEIGPIPEGSEIGEVMFSSTLPEKNTHPDIQPFLFKEILKYLGKQL